MQQPSEQIVGTQERTESEFERLLRQDFTPRDLMAGDHLDRIERIAERLASSKITVPEYLRGNVGDCMAIAMQAMLWNMEPFAVAQKTHIVSGKLGYEAQLVNAVLQNSGAIRGVPHYEYRGEGGNLECRVGCVLRGDTEIRWGEWLNFSMVKVKNSPLWAVNPRQQLGYLQVKNWARAFVPGAILGIYTVDELEDSMSTAAPATPKGPQRKSDTAAAANPPVAEPAATVSTAAAADPETGEVSPPPAASAAKNPSATDARGLISTGQVAYLRNKLKAAGMAEKVVAGRYSVETIEQLNVDAFDELKSELLAMH